jgi:hypothetical protein
MKNLNLTKLRAAATRTKARPSLLADAELNHLEQVMRLIAGAAPYTPIYGLDMAYWRRRIAFIESSFELLPIHRSRIKVLLALLD